MKFSSAFECVECKQVLFEIMVYHTQTLRIPTVHNVQTVLKTTVVISSFVMISLGVFF
jgi:hypothetical protein